MVIFVKFENKTKQIYSCLFDDIFIFEKKKIKNENEIIIIIIIINFFYIKACNVIIIKELNFQFV